jgi:dTDP-L-rhamnose 4-epimerase
MFKKILITGGAGFIGSHLTDELLKRGHSVRILDNLSEQVHGPDRQPPVWLSPEAELVTGDVRNPEDLEKALSGIDVVFHFAASVGVGQSMYLIKDYMEVNNLGTAILLEKLVKHPVEKLIIASSMSIYGEGYYRNPEGKLIEVISRDLSRMKQNQWEITDNSGNILSPVPTGEKKRPSLASVYALSKYDQEQMCLILGQAYHLPVIALRFFNVYGTRQSLSNPYTGVLAIFASRLLNNKEPLIFEDGMQRRDFVNIKDIVLACCLAMEKDIQNEIFNIGSGESFTINEIALQLASVMGKDHIQPQILQKYRAGDIRHCFADITKANNLLNYHPGVTLKNGLAEYSEWLSSQIAVDIVDKAREELISRGLAV